MHKPVMRAAALLVILFSASLWAAPVPWLPLENTTAERVPDSVFGGEVVVYEAGPADAETVVLIHGIGDNGARDWRSLIMDLASTYHVVAVDMPGFAASSKGNHLYAPEQLAIAVHGAISKRATQPYSLIGHSLGAAVSLAYAGLYAEEMQRLILVDMPGVLHRTVYTRFLSDQGAAMLGGMFPLGGDWVNELLTSQLEQLEVRGFNPALLLHSPMLRQQLLGGDPKVISAYAVAQHDYSRALRDLRVPTLVLWGEQDQVTPLRTGQLVAATIPDARLKVFPEVGHVPMAQVPQAFNATIRDELSGRLASLPAYALVPEAPESGRKLSCKNRTGMRFSGQIKQLQLVNCKDVVIERANIGHLAVSGGNVHLLNTHVFDGIDAHNTRLKLTAGSVRGEMPLTLKGSAVDAAGTHFISDYDLAKNDGNAPATLVFSVAVQEDKSGRSRSLHEVVSLPAKGIWP